MSLLYPAPEDVVADVAFLRVLRASHKVPQARWNFVFRHDEPNGFQTWIGGPRFAIRPQALTLHRVLAHDAPMPVRVVDRLPPHPPSSAAILLAVEVDGVPLTVDVPHTRIAATAPLPLEVTLALGGPLVAPARWFRDVDDFAAAQRDEAGGDTGSVRAARSLVDLRLFEAGAGALVSGIVEHVEPIVSPLVGEVTTVVVRTIVDIPFVVWCAPAQDPPPPGSVFDGLVATSGFSRELV